MCYRYTVNEFVCSLSTVLNTGTLNPENALPVYRHLICSCSTGRKNFSDTITFFHFSI